uniref:Putative secreted peptide n=1 Tax=Anopheles braziliensis TaxID=58242 RepID=A0A2M3ZTB0_9DIPT
MVCFRAPVHMYILFVRFLLSSGRSFARPARIHITTTVNINGNLRAMASRSNCRRGISRTDFRLLHHPHIKAIDTGYIAAAFAERRTRPYATPSNIIRRHTATAGDAGTLEITRLTLEPNAGT